LLRSGDAVNREGLRMLKAMKAEPGAKAIVSYLGWEQEFFVVSAERYRNRPDLVNCGRTLLGRLPERNQQADLNYFNTPSTKVKELLTIIQAKMLTLGCAMIVKHNEVAPGQHEMSPIFSTATHSSDSNALFMQISAEEAMKMDLAVLFHEKPFAGINGNGKHCNWSIGTDSGVNFFYPGKTDKALELYVTAVACLTYGLKHHSDLVRCAVAHAGNDHRLGAQEAPPAIISLYPGQSFEAHIDNIIKGGPLTGYDSSKKTANPGSRNTMEVPTGVEDRNRTAPFPFCGNRFEFRAVGGSQNCAMPVSICNTLMASGMAHMSSLLEGGKSLRDAVAQVYKENREIIFTGNGYSAEWPIEAEKRGLKNLRTTPEAAKVFNSDKAKAVFKKMGIFEPSEVDARAELMYESYNTILGIEAKTLVRMVETGIIPACAKDLATYKEAPFLAGDRPAVYKSIKVETDKLRDSLAKVPSDHEAEAHYYCNTVKPQMETLRSFVDEAEGLMQAGLYPYPTYEDLVYGHSA